MPAWRRAVHSMKRSPRRLPSENRGERCCCPRAGEVVATGWGPAVGGPAVGIRRWWLGRWWLGRRLGRWWLGRWWLGRWWLGLRLRRRRFGRWGGLRGGFGRGLGLRRSRWPPGVTAILGVAARRRRRAIPLRCTQTAARREAATAVTVAARDALLAALAGTALGHRDQLRRGPSIHVPADDFPDPYGLRKAAEAPGGSAAHRGSEAPYAEDHNRQRNDECYPSTRPWVLQAVQADALVATPR